MRRAALVPGRAPWMAVAALFFLSGASSLAYEVVWVKVLSLHFGSSGWSISTVVASFMAGLGAGCALAGRRSERIRRPLRAYALLELGIVLFGSISIPLLNGLDSVIGPLHQLLEGHAAGFALARFFVSFMVLLIPTFLMGASLPVLVVGLASEGNFEKRVACLYGVNTLGGAAGVLVTGLWLLPARGISGTVEVAVAVGLLVTALAFGLDRFASVRPRMVEAMPPASGGRPPWILLFALLMVGGLGIVQEIAWTRMLLPVVGSSAYAFSIILGTFLIGIGSGSFLAATRLGRCARGRAVLAGTIAIASFSALGSLFLVNHLPDLFRGMMDASSTSGAWLFLSQGMLTGALVLLPACGLGAALPFGISGWRRETGATGTAVGWIYSSNTLGAILGSWLAGFFLLPWIGAEGALRLACTVGVFLAVVLLLSEKGLTLRIRGLFALVLTGSLVGLLLASPTVDLKGSTRACSAVSMS